MDFVVHDFQVFTSNMLHLISQIPDIFASFCYKFFVGICFEICDGSFVVYFGAVLEGFTEICFRH